MQFPEHLVASLDDISDPGASEFRRDDPDWPFRGIVVHWQGKVFAYANSCAHLGHALNLEPNKFFNSTNDQLICSSHGAVFEPDTGVCISGPCSGKRLISLDCRVTGKDIYVRAPESQRELDDLRAR